MAKPMPKFTTLSTTKDTFGFFFPKSPFSGIFFSIAPIAQLVEQLPFKEKVPGPNPGGRTALRKICTAADFLAVRDGGMSVSRQTAESGSRNFSAEKYL